MIKNIVFDIGNVLAAFQWEEHFRQFGYPEDILKRLAKATVLSGMWGELDRRVLSEEELMELFSQNDPELEPVIRECLSTYCGMLRMYDYTIPWIRELRQKGYKVYYLSNMPAIASRDCAEELAFTDETDGGILSWTERIIKPDPAIYQLFLERYELKPEECVFLDDTEKNIKGACSVGMYGILFQSKEQACEELRKLKITKE